MARDYYKVLEVPRSASDAEIRRAYRRLARRYETQARRRDSKWAAAELVLIDDAYRTLSDGDSRRAYDAALQEAREKRTETVTSMTARAVSTAPVVEQESGGAQQREGLDWSKWAPMGFSLFPGRMPLWFAAMVMVLFDRLYRVFLVETFGNEAAAATYFALFVLGASASPFVAYLRGRSWFLWGVLGFAGGVPFIVVTFGNPISHAVVLTLLLARPGRPPCPNCGRRVERGKSECPKCHVDLSGQPVGQPSESRDA